MRIEILKRTGPTTITLRWRQDGTVVDAGAVTFDLIGSDGVSVRTGTATKAGSGATTTYAVAVTVAEAAVIEEYSLEWTHGSTAAVLVDYLGIVGSVLFTEAQARAFEVVGGLNPLAEAEFTDQQLGEARYRVQEFIEKRTGESMVRRLGRGRARGDGSDELRLAKLAQLNGGAGFRRLPLDLVSGVVNGTALTAGEIANVEADDLGHKLTRYDGNVWASATGNQPPRNVTVGYEYGYRVVPWEATRAGIVLLIKALVPSDVSSRATSFSNQDGTFRLSMPSLAHPTGIPEIDEFINAHNDYSLFA